MQARCATTRTNRISTTQQPAPFARQLYAALPAVAMSRLDLGIDLFGHRSHDLAILEEPKGPPLRT